jgi:hypothetical protein
VEGWDDYTIFLNQMKTMFYSMYAWPDGSMYEGEFKDGQYEGQGTYTCVDGHIYEGEFKQGQYHGTPRTKGKEHRFFLLGPMTK